MKSEGGDILTAVVPLLKLLSLAITGLVLAHSRFRIVPKETFKLLSKLVFALFLPCLIFTNLGPIISLEKIKLWWFIPVNVFVSTTIGCLLGFLVAKSCRPPLQYFRFTIIMTALGNTCNLPLAIIESVCQDSDNPFGEECYGSGVAYVSLSQWVSVILVYTFVYHMMEPPLEYYEIVDGGVEIVEQEPEITEEVDDSNSNNNNDLSTPLLVEAEWPGINEKETEDAKTPFLASLFNSISGISERNIPDFDSAEDRSVSMSTKSIRCLAEPKVVRKVRIVAEKTPIRHILQPPTIASLLAIIIGIIPTLKSLVFGDDVALSFITDSLVIIAEAMVPSTMLVLGRMLAEGPTESNLGIRTTIGIIVARLLILPVIGIGVILLADKWNLLVPEDELYRFVLWLQYATPSAILLGAIASLRGYAVREASALLFWQHVFAVFSLSFYIILYFKLLLSYI